MQNQSLYPLMLQPSLHIKVWGGKRLNTVLNKRVPSDDPYGESWELHDSAIVGNGPLAGKNLGELATEFGEYLLGDGVDAASGFHCSPSSLTPIHGCRFKYIPTMNRRVSWKANPVAKPKPGSLFMPSQKPGWSWAANRARLVKLWQMQSARICSKTCCTIRQVRAGDVLYIPANTIHALGPGLLIYEIQQSSDTTYRLYDWGRMGLTASRVSCISTKVCKSPTWRKHTVGRPPQRRLDRDRNPTL